MNLLELFIPRDALDWFVIGVLLAILILVIHS